ncbi:NAD(P)H-quinone oxidoreductase [Pelagibacterium halotolerans]|uniref:NAD(P)H-quinone oxidoreductase n=1 Tax=Pelagibacterium halotolerans TaxID=531813 RepID=UPI00384CD69D
MLAIAINGSGGPNVLTPIETEKPVPASGEVLVKVAAAGVNGPDISQREGRYAPPRDASPLPGLEVSGIVEVVGSNVAAFGPGDAVVALTNGGGYAEYVTAPAGQVLPKPESWSWIEAATIPETFFTIQQTLVERAGLAADKTVLIHGGSGGLGTTAIQMTKLFGGTAIATVSTEEKAAYARQMGADAAINYREEDFVERTLALTNGKGADIIVDIIAGSYANRNLKAAAPGGHILQLAIREGAKSEINMGLILMKALTISGSTLRPKSAADKTRYASALKQIVWPAIANRRIRPPRIRTFPLAAAADAHRAMEAPDHYGKIVLVTEFGVSL